VQYLPKSNSSHPKTFNNFYSRLCTYLIFQKYVQNLHSLSSCVNCYCLAKIIKCSFIYLIYLYKETFKVYKSCKLLTWITISSAEFKFRNANTAALPFVRKTFQRTAIQTFLSIQFLKIFISLKLMHEYLTMGSIL
jgi:hypothetical protein